MAIASKAKSTVSETEANSILGPSGGWCDATTSVTEESLDLSAMAGRYVKIYCETVGHYFSFGSAAVASGNILVTAAATTLTAGVVDVVDANGAGVHVVVPRDNPHLHYRAVSATGILRVIPV